MQAHIVRNEEFNHRGGGATQLDRIRPVPGYA
jgi:hypothetical protein